jgi:hypothetical protein
MNIEITNTTNFTPLQVHEIVANQSALTHLRGLLMNKFDSAINSLFHDFEVHEDLIAQQMHDKANVDFEVTLKFSAY